MSRQQQEAIGSPGAWLTTVASRICLDLLGSARARRETYVGAWIPEPLPEPTEWINGRSGGITADPADRVTLDESINMAFLVVLESMTPAERVAFILHDVFRYSYLTILQRTVNGQPGLVAQQDGITVTVMAFDIAGDRIKHIWAVRNPEKLRPWTG
jgi:DNA-directed RNA polymerase specialized sigma24 family protein